MAKTRKRPEKTRQTYLNGMESPRLPEVDDAADNYFDLAKEKAKVQEEEDEAKEKLIELMRKHKLKRYETEGGKVVTVSDEVKFKVKVEKPYREDDDE